MTIIKIEIFLTNDGAVTVLIRNLSKLSVYDSLMCAGLPALIN